MMILLDESLVARIVVRLQRLIEIDDQFAKDAKEDLNEIASTLKVVKCAYCEEYKNFIDELLRVNASILVDNKSALEKIVSLIYDLHERLHLGTRPRP